jgi:hypothetical protein
LSLVMYTRISVCTSKKRFLWGPHTMLVVILDTVWQSFPCQLLLQCCDPYDILHCTFHTDTFWLNKHAQGKFPGHTKFWYPSRDWLGWRFCQKILVRQVFDRCVILRDRHLLVLKSLTLGGCVNAWSLAGFGWESFTWVRYTGLTDGVLPMDLSLGHRTGEWEVWWGDIFGWVVDVFLGGTAGEEKAPGHGHQGRSLDDTHFQTVPFCFILYIV